MLDVIALEESVGTRIDRFARIETPRPPPPPPPMIRVTRPSIAHGKLLFQTCLLQAYLLK